MSQNNLSKVSKEEKIQFLKKLQSGKFRVKPSGPPGKSMFLEWVEPGLYKNTETGELFTRDQVDEMVSNYMYVLEYIETMDKEPTNYKFVPYPEGQFLNNFLTSLDEEKEEEEI